MTPLLAIDAVSQTFAVAPRGLFGTPRALRAVADVSLAIAPGRSVGLVGESGCGKSTLARIAAGFITPTAGEVRLDGRALVENGRAIAGRRQIQMVFQNPLGALDARMRIGAQIEEALTLGGLPPKQAATERDRLLENVGLDARFAGRYPHELSGGQRQRVVLARALAAQPRLLICDEPLAALDVSVQAQILALLSDLKSRLGLTLLFISHQLSTVRYLCDEVAVMYGGRIVEQGETEQVFTAPRHPYTRMLLSTALDPRRRHHDRLPVVGEPPNPMALPTGCPFHPRCPSRIAGRCETDRPELEQRPSSGLVACHAA
ncbi:MAG TPA: ABC transporter ATP-binding protein [Devosiaceae bacterium]